MRMKNYVIEIKDELLNPILTDSIKAENADSAYEKFIYKMRAEHKDIPFRIVYVKGGMLEENRFEPPHYDGHKEKPASTSNESKQQVSGSIENKLDRLYDVMNHIRWIGLGIGGMFAITFILPQCTGG